MLAHTGRPSGRPRNAPQSRFPASAGAPRSCLAAAKRFFVFLLVMLTSGTALAGIMALRIAIYLPRWMHH